MECGRTNKMLLLSKWFLHAFLVKFSANVDIVRKENLQSEEVKDLSLKKKLPLKCYLLNICK